MASYVTLCAGGVTMRDARSTIRNIFKSAKLVGGALRALGFQLPNAKPKHPVDRILHPTSQRRTFCSQVTPIAGVKQSDNVWRCHCWRRPTTPHALITSAFVPVPGPPSVSPQSRLSPSSKPIALPSSASRQESDAAEVLVC
jgi:hypothetical protein